MFKRANLFTLVICLLFLSGSSQNLDQAIDKAALATVRITYEIKANDIYGNPVTNIVRATGVLIGADSVLTCYHVFGGEFIGKISAMLTRNGEFITRTDITIIKYDINLDLVLLRMSPEFNSVPVKFATDPTVLGSDIFFIGMTTIQLPAIRFCKYTVGSSGIMLFPVYHGDSGGGVFNSQGELIGIIQGGLMFKQPVEYSTLIGFASPLEKIKRFLDIK